LPIHRHEPFAAFSYRSMVTGAALALVLQVAAAAALGPYRLAPGDLLAFLMAKATGAASPLSGPAETVILQIRLPRVLAAVAIGAAQAASGAAYQSLFRNPLVSPDILGVSAGAAFGAVVGIFRSLPVLAIEATSFAGGLAAVIIPTRLSPAPIALRYWPTEDCCGSVRRPTWSPPRRCALAMRSRSLFFKSPTAHTGSVCRGHIPAERLLGGKPSRLLGIELREDLGRSHRQVA
jgi:hypothetical protein